MHTLVCTCAFGLESILKKELYKLGYTPAASSDGAIEIQGTNDDILMLNMSLRCCDRVLLHMGTAKAETFDELFGAASAIAWEDIIVKDGKFDVAKITCVKSKLMSKSDAQRIIKKAIVERLKAKYKTASLVESGAVYQIYVKIKNDDCSFYLNTSGESLHKRGYRMQQGDAPLKETLAAGIILLSGYNGTQPFADIMCGSGTFVIEAALIASHTPPCLKRGFAFETWGISSPEARQLLRQEAEAKIIKPDIRLLGSDIDKKSVVHAKNNAVSAKTDDITAFQTLDFRKFSSQKRKGILVLNPPYGQRIGDISALREMYKDLRGVFKSLEDWRMYVLCGNEDFQRFYGERADKNRKLYNGDLLTYLYQYF